MSRPVVIKGGAGEFHAALIAVVIDHIVATEKNQVRRVVDHRLPEWIRAVDPDRFPDLDTRDRTR